MTGQIERIRVFAKVAECNSFAEAARRLNITRSIATRYVSELEQELGAQLLVRTTRKVSLTVGGRMYLERTLPLLEDLARADEIVKQQTETLQGELRVSAPFPIGQTFLPQALSQFLETYPQMTLKIELADQFVDILSGDYDMSLRVSGPPKDVSTIWRKIASVPRIMVGSSDYLAQFGVPQVPHDLANHTELGYTHFASGPHWNLSHNETGETQSVQLKRRFECNSGALITQLALRGQGLAMVPQFIVSEYLITGQLQRILPDWSSPEVWLTAYYPPYDVLPAKVAAFTSFIEDLVKADPALLS